jgi:hypothetical protein
MSEVSYQNEIALLHKEREELLAKVQQLTKEKEDIVQEAKKHVKQWKDEYALQAKRYTYLATEISISEFDFIN